MDARQWRSDPARGHPPRSALGFASGQLDSAQRSRAAGTRAYLTRRSRRSLVATRTGRRGRRGQWARRSLPGARPATQHPLQHGVRGRTARPLAQDFPQQGSHRRSFSPLGGSAHPDDRLGDGCRQAAEVQVEVEGLVQPRLVDPHRFELAPALRRRRSPQPVAGAIRGYPGAGRRRG
jgi:hypothetical protein